MLLTPCLPMQKLELDKVKINNLVQCDEPPGVLQEKTTVHLLLQHRTATRILCPRMAPVKYRTKLPQMQMIHI